MSPEERAACLAALEAADRAAAALRAVLANKPPEWVPLSVACAAWGVSKEAGLKRARRGAGRKVAGRWLVPRTALTEVSCPKLNRSGTR